MHFVCETMDVGRWAALPAATAKQKAKYISKMGERAKDLRSIITKYNNVVQHFPESGYTATSFDEIKSGEYHWTETRARKHIGECFSLYQTKALYTKSRTYHGRCLSFHELT